MVKFFFINVLLILSFQVNAQIEFLKIYSDLGFEKGEGITQLSDSSYLVTGSSTSFGQGPPQAFLMKLDSLGNHKWTKHYGGAEINEGKRVFALENFGYYVGGNTNSNALADHNFYLVKTDENGDPIFEKQVGTPGWDFVHDGIILADSSIILTGETYNTLDGMEDSYTVRFDKNGDTIWTSQSHKLGIDKIYAAENVGDTAFALAGTRWNADSLMQKAFVGFYYYDNSPIWELEFGEIGEYALKDIEVYSNRIYGVGNRINPSDNKDDEYTLQIHLANGGMISTYSYYGLSDKSGEAIVKYGSGIDFYIGFEFEDQITVGVGDDIFLSKYDDFFSFQGIGIQFFQPGQDDIGQLISTSDGGVILVGTNRSFGSGNANVLLLKIGPNDSLPAIVAFPVIESLVSTSVVEQILNAEIWPNPFKNDVKIQFEENVSGIVQVYSFIGELVASSEVKDKFVELNLSSLKSGAYFLKLISNDKQSMIGRILKYE